MDSTLQRLRAVCAATARLLFFILMAIKLTSVEVFIAVVVLHGAGTVTRDRDDVSTVQS